MKKIFLNLADSIECKMNHVKRSLGMHFTDSFYARGDVVRTIRDRDGNIVDVDGDHNLIVKIGRNELIKKIAGQSTLGQITICGVGSGGVNPASPFNPIDPVDGDVDLYTKIFTKQIDTVNVVLTGTNPQVTFTTLFTCDEVNSLISECAIYFSDGTTMFARHTFKTVPLDIASGFSIEIAWTIQF
jgi:hypothetical protein